MKSKKFFVVVLAMLMTLCFGMFVACGEEEQKEATKLTIDSKTEATIEVGQAYTLQYTCNGTVTVTVSGGSYDAASQRFTASEPGNYTLTVTGVEEGKTETVIEVKITVIAGADRSALTAALEKYNALTAGDYTSQTWSKARSAALAAEDILEESGITQAEIDEAADDLNSALDALVPAEITRAAASEESIVWNGTTYLAADYKNFEEIFGKVNTLNADTTVKLRSEYTKKIEEILAQLDAKLTLNLTGGLTRGGKMLVSALREYKIVAESAEGATFTWKVDGTAQTATGAELAFTPTEYGKDYTVECTATNGTESNTKSFTVSFEQVTYQNNMGDGITVSDDVINVTKNDYGWGDQMGKKVTLPDLYLNGEFSVTFDLTFTEQGPGGTRCMALFLLNADGNTQGIWYAVVHQTPWLEVTFEDAETAKIRKEMPSGTVDVGKVMHFSMNRVVKDGTAYLTADLLDDRGNVIFHNDGDNRTTNNNAVMLGIQIESMACKIENLAVKCDGLVNLTALRAAVKENTGKYLQEDYTQNTYATFESTLQAANLLLSSKGATTAEAVNDALKAIETAAQGLTPAEVVKATVTEDKITYKETEYNAADYETDSFADVKGKVEALNSRSDLTTNSAYRTELEKLLDELVPFVSVEITGIEERVALVSVLPRGLVTLTATSREGATYAWEVDGENKGTLDRIQITPAFKIFTVKVTATYEGRNVEKTVKFGWEQVTYQNNKPDAISTENDVITITQDGLDWGDNEGRKVILGDVYLKGNFTVYFDLKFTYHWGGSPTDANVFALFLLDASGNSKTNWVAVCQQVNKLETAFGGDGPEKPQLDMPEDIKNEDGTTKLDTVLHFSVTREIESGKAYLIARLLKEDGTVWLEHRGMQGDNRLSKDYVGPVLLGIQAENTKFELSNITVSSDSEIVGKSALRKAVQEAQLFVLSDYTDTNNFQSKLTAAQLVLMSESATRESVETVLSELLSAMEDLTPKAFEKAAVGADTITYNGKEYNKASYNNFDEIVEQVTQLNGEDLLLSEYEARFAGIIAQLDAKIKVTLKGVENYILATTEGASFTFTAETGSENATFAWKIDGTSQQGTAKELTYTPTFGEHTVQVTVSADGAEITVEKNFTIQQANFKVRSGDASKTHLNGNVFSSETGIVWGSWEGSNFLLDDLVFNGSFSIQANVKWKNWSDDHGAGQVLTFHLLNADTLSPNSERDKAIVSYGAILLQESGDGQRLEAHNGGHRWKFEDSYGGKINVGDTFTIKLTAKKDLSNKYHVSFSLYNPASGTWIDYAPSDVASGEMGNGMIVGMNIENSAFEVSGFSYELLAGSGYLTGSVASKAVLHNTLTGYEETVREYYSYPNGVELLEAYHAAYGVFKDNSNSADYEGALEALEAAHTALGEKQTVAVSVEGLDSGATRVRGNTFTAKITGDTSEVYWTYGESATRADGETLTLPAGRQTDITLHFTLGGQQYTYRYQDITVEGLGLRTENGDKVTITDEKVTVTDGAGWGAQRQLVVDGLYTQEFVFSFDAKKLPGHEDDANSVVAIRTFEGLDDMTAVIGYSREAVGRKMHIGYNQGTGYVETFADDVRNSLWQDGAHIVLKQVQRADGAMVQTFSIYKADGTFVASQDSINYINHFDSGTGIYIGFENISLELTNIRICYLG